MRRRSFLHYTLEIIVILGYLVLGVTIFSFYFHSPRLPFDRVFIGSLILAVGVLEFTDFITWKFAVKMRSIQSFVAAILSIALGIIFMIIKMNPRILCTIWGVSSIVFAIVRISTAAINLVFQPLLNSVKIIISIIQMVFSVLLLVRTLNAVNSYILFLGIAFAIAASVLFIEFMIHRYQRI